MTVPQPLGPPRRSPQAPSWIARCSAVALTAVLIGIAVMPLVKKYRSDEGSSICLANLDLIGKATAQYLEDSDGIFPPAWQSNPLSWQDLIRPDLNGLRASTAENRSQDVRFHCPADHTGPMSSYGVNAMVAGAYVFSDEKRVRSPLYQDSLQNADIADPGKVFWAADTNKLWEPTKRVYTDVALDWERRTDAPLIGRSLPKTVAWYRDFLAQDYTDNSLPCPAGGQFGCKGPAYRHNRHGPRTGSVGMLFCDGHAASLPFGRLTVSNVFPNLQDSTLAAAMAIKNNVFEDEAQPVTKTRYSVTFLGDGYYHGGCLNNLGHVAAVSQINGYLRSYLIVGGRKTDLGSLPGYPNTLALGMNDHDQVVGWAFQAGGPTDDPSLTSTLSGQSRAFLWTAGRMSALQTLPGYTSALAASINNAGQIAGRSYSPNDQSQNWTWPSQAVFWEHNRVEGLGLPGGYKAGRAYAIDPQGTVVGTAVASGDHTHAICWRQGILTDLGLLPGGSIGSALAVAGDGTIGGNSQTRGGAVDAVVWRSGTIQDLGRLADTVYSKVDAMNDRGGAVGEAIESGDSVAICFDLRTPGHDTPSSLNTPEVLESGLVLNKTFGINNRGQILAWGEHQATGGALALLTPTGP